MQWGKPTSEKTRREEAGYQKFSVFPVQMDDGTWVWLEKYWKSMHQMQHFGTDVVSRAIQKKDLKKF